MPGMDMTNAFIKAHKYDTAIGAYLAVIKGVADDSVALPGAANVDIRGFTVNAGALGETHPIQMSGFPYATAGAAFASEANLAVHGVTGKLRLAAAGERVVAKAMEAATADGDVVRVMVKFSVGV